MVSDMNLIAEFERTGMGKEEIINIWRKIVSVIFRYFKYSLQIF